MKLLKLLPPFCITARLEPGLRIGDGCLSLKAVRRDHEDRVVYRWAFDIPAGEFEGEDLRSGCGQKVDYQDMFAATLGFLGAAVESLQYRTRRGESLDDDRDDGLFLFPLPVVQWAEMYDDEISVLRHGIEETHGLIEEETT